MFSLGDIGSTPLLLAGKRHEEEVAMQLPMSNVGFTELKKLTHKHPTTLIVLYGTEPDRQSKFCRNKLPPFPTIQGGEG